LRRRTINLDNFGAKVLKFTNILPTLRTGVQVGIKLFSGILSAVFGITTIGGAGAQTIFIGSGPAGSIVTLASGEFITSAIAPDDTFSVTAQDFSSGADLGSTNATISVLANPGVTLSIWVSETDINLGPTPQKLSFLSGLTQNQLPAGATVTETTWFDASNAQYGTGTLLATHTFTSIGSISPSATVIDALAPYSITEEYDITFSLPSAPTALSTITLGTTTDGPIPIVPEPSTWMMMAIGFAGLGFAGYSRSRRSLARVA
jgi:PEP-CTERM motif